MYIYIHIFITTSSVTGSETIYGARGKKKKRDWKHSPLNPAGVKTYKKDHGLKCVDNTEPVLCSAASHGPSVFPVLYLCPWHRLLCTLGETHSAAVDPVISSGNPAICRQIQTFTSAPEPPTYILIHIPAPLCSLSRRHRPWISLPLQRDSGSP